MSGNSERPEEETSVYRCERCQSDRFICRKYACAQVFLNLEDKIIDEGEWEVQDISVWECYVCGAGVPEHIERALTQLHVDLTL